MNRIGAHSETDQLQTVILGTALDWGGIPLAEDCYDPRSLESVQTDSYPDRETVFKQLEAFKNVLESHGVDVLRPICIESLNQVFARDISFVVDDKFVIPHIIEDRQKELDGILPIIDKVDAYALLKMPEGAHAEGGDVLLWHNYIFIGCSEEEEFLKYKVARTNQAGVDFIQSHFPNKVVKTFKLNKSDTDPRKNTLHLDCCFQPIGKNKALLYPAGFQNEEDVEWIVNYFGEENIFIVTEDEAYHLFPNVFSINAKIIVSNSSFSRLNDHLRDWGFIVEEIEYDAVAQMGGLLRCTTQPLYRKSMRQTTSHILMVRPAAFRMNEQTAVNNFYQKQKEGLSPQEIREQAIAEFDRFAERLSSAGVRVHIIQDEVDPSTPDALFPNNWMSLHENGSVALYPMYAANRRQERRMEIFDELKSKGYQINTILDFTALEDLNQFMEGTGSLVLDRVNRIAYAALSERTNRDAVLEVCQSLGFKACMFNAFQSVDGKRVPIYHTNVMMCIGSSLAAVCLDCIDDETERAALKNVLLESGKEILELSEAQINQFAGNMLQLESEDGRTLFVMSEQACKSLTVEQLETIEQSAHIIDSPLDIIEELGGGSARCMIAENFLPYE